MRRGLVFIFSVILLVCLIGIVFTTSLQTSLMRPQTVEKWIAQSNVYGSISSTIALKAQKSIYNDIPGGSSISSSVIQKAAQNAFPVPLTRQVVTGFLTSNYAWLKGVTNIPRFTIDLTKEKQQFVSQVASQAAQSHLGDLPKCSLTEAPPLSSTSPLLLGCLPIGINTQAATSLISQQLLSTKGYLQNPVITPTDISTSGINVGGQPYYLRLSSAPKIYQFIQKLPWILAIGILASLTAVVLGSRKKRFGMLLISLVFLFSSLAVLAARQFTTSAASSAQQYALRHVTEQPLSQSLSVFLHLLRNKIMIVDDHFIIIYLVLMLLLGCVFMLLRFRSKTPKKVLSSAHPESSSISHKAIITEVTRANMVQPKKRHPRPPKLIQ